MEILVTGGMGFIGSHLVDELVKQGHRVTILDDFSSGRDSNITAETASKLRAIYREGLHASIVESLFEKSKFDYVFHLAARAKIGWCEEHPVEANVTNVDGTLRLLQLSKKYAVKGFIFSSSSSVYGDKPEENPAEEIMDPAPKSIYGIQKLVGEQFCEIFHRVYNVPTVSLRYFNVYGTSRQNPAGPYPNVFSAFYRDMTEQKKIHIYGDGLQRRDFIHVYDVVSANMFFLNKPEFLDGKPHNIGTGVATTINAIAEHFPVERVYEPERAGDPKFSCANTWVTEGLGWQHSISLAQGIKIFFKSHEK